MDFKHNVKWFVSLSNGETLYESKGNYCDIKGEPSPWLRLLKYTQENKLEITSCGLYTDDGKIFNLPSNGKNPKFKDFAEIEKPLDYLVCRKLARDIVMVGDRPQKTEISDWFTVAKAFYPTYTLEIWVDENNTNNCWTLVVKK
jgi:hypothetical protein